MNKTNNKKQLKIINKTCFPVPYSESFYDDVVKSRNDNLNKFAYHNGFVIGAICSRIEPIPLTNNNDSEEGSSRMYIVTLGVLAAYRNRGVGQKLVQSVLDYYNQAMNQSDATDATTRKDEIIPKEEVEQLKKVKEIALHVQISNFDAIKFYTEKFGFEQCEKVENYYKRIDPPHCYVLRKKLVN